MYSLLINLCDHRDAMNKLQIKPKLVYNVLTKTKGKKCVNNQAKIFSPQVRDYHDQGFVA